MTVELIGFTVIMGCCRYLYVSHDMTKPTKWLRPAKIRISLGICPVSESSLCAQWVAKVPSFLHADSEVWSDWADAQADLSLRWAHSHFVGFVMTRLTWIMVLSLGSRNPTPCSCLCIFHWKVDEKATIGNRYKRIPHPALDTKWERNTHNLDNIE